MRYLNDRELDVLRKRRQEKLTYQQIGDAIGVTRHRAKNLHDQAVDKLILRELEAKTT